MKKLLVVLLSLFTVFTLCGCAEEGGSNTIKIGGSGPLSGGAALYGTAVKNAAEMAVEEVNALGGLQFELRIEDDEHNPEKAVTSYGVLKDWGMQVSLSCVTSKPAEAVSQDYCDDFIFALTPSASSASVTLKNANDPGSFYGNVFQMCFNDPNQGLASAEYISKNGLGTKIAVIYNNEDVYSKGIFEKFSSKAPEVGLEIVSTGTFTDESDNDFSVQVSKAKEAGAEVVFLPIYYTPASKIFEESKKQDFAPIFFGVDGMDGVLDIEGFDTSLAEGVYLLTPFSADSTEEKSANFTKNYKERYGETPNQFAADAYDCVYALYQACTNANVTPDMSASDICELMLSQFTSMTFEGITGNATWGRNGEVSKDPKAVIIKNGTYVSAE